MELFIFIFNIYNELCLIINELQIEALYILNKYGGIED